MSCQDMSHDGNQAHGGTSRGPAFNRHVDKDIGAGVIGSCVSVVWAEQSSSIGGQG